MSVSQVPPLALALKYCPVYNVHSKIKTLGAGKQSCPKTELPYTTQEGIQQSPAPALLQCFSPPEDKKVFLSYLMCLIF